MQTVISRMYQTELEQLKAQCAAYFNLHTTDLGEFPELCSVARFLHMFTLFKITTIVYVCLCTKIQKCCGEFAKNSFKVRRNFVDFSQI